MVSLLAFLFIMMLPIRTNAASTKELLENYAKSQTYLGNNGVTYHGYLKKFITEGTDGYFRYFPPTDIPQNPISYRIDDFDEDGEYELLIVKFNNNQYIILDMYEVENNKAVLKDSTEVRIHEAEIGYHYLKTSLELNIGKSNCYVYSYNGRKMIGVEESGSSFIDADGICIDCAMISYDGTGFINEADTSFIGSAYDDDFPGTFKNSFKSLGINVDAEKLLSGEKLPSDYIKDCEIFAGVIHDFPSENYDKYLKLRDEVGIFNNITNISFIMKNTEGTENIDVRLLSFDNTPYNVNNNLPLNISATYVSSQKPSSINWISEMQISRFSEPTIQGPDVTGKKNTWKISTTVTFNNPDNYKKDWISLKVDGMSADTEISIILSDETTYLKFNMLPKDNWCIWNNKLGFGYATNEDYIIPDERYAEVFGDDYVASATTDHKKYESMIYTDWNGNCFGLSASAILFNTGKLNLNNYKNNGKYSSSKLNDYCNAIYDFQFPRLDKDDDCTKLIERYQIIQKRTQNIPIDVFNSDDGGREGHYWNIHEAQNNNPVFWEWIKNGDYISNCLDAIKKSDKPLLFSMHDNEYSHTVVIRSDKPITKHGEWYRVYIYDSNHPSFDSNIIKVLSRPSFFRTEENDTYIELNPKKNLWRYPEPEATIIYGSNNGTTPNIVFKSKDNELYPAFIELEDATKLPTKLGNVDYLPQNAQEIHYTHDSVFGVSDSSNRILAEHRNGEMKIYSKNIINHLYTGSETENSGFGCLVYNSTEPINITFEKGSDISVLSEKKVLNIYSDEKSEVKADLNQGLAVITSSSQENAIIQMTNIHGDNKYTSAIIDGTIDSNDTITLKLDDNDNTSIDSSGDKSNNLVLYTNTENDNNDQKVGELENLDGQEYDIKKKKLKPKPDTRYTITYNLSGGKVSGNPTSYTKNTSSFTLNNPTKDGYTFKGWTGSNGTTPQMTVTVKIGTTGNLSYTANWEKKKDYRPAFVEDKNTYTDLPYDYYEALKTLENDWKWSPSVHTQFALAYLDNNNVPDLLYRFEENQDIFDILLLNNTGTTGVSGYNDVITENYYYPKTGVYCGYGYDPNYEGKFSENYLKVEGNKTSYVLGRFYNDKFGYEYYYTDFEMSHKLPNKAAFDKELKKLVGNAPRTKLKVYDNTEANRKSVILAHVKQDPTPVKGKKTNPITAKGLKKTLKAKSLKKKARTFKLITVKKAIGKVTYKVTGGNKKSKKALKINSKTGKITVKKKTKKGTYKIKVKVSAAGNKNYKSGSKTVTVTVKVK